MNENRPNLPLRLALGFLLGGALAPAVVYLIGPLWVAAESGAGEAVGSLWAARLPPVPVTPAMAEAVGSAAGALLLQSFLGGIVGALAALATLPFADDGQELVRNSLFHFAVTAAAFSLLLWVCRWVDQPRYVALWVLLLALLYGLIWLGRWIGWYMEVVQLRALLGLEPGPSPLKWRETLPYLPLILLTCGLLPAVLLWIDRRVVVDVPVLSGVVLPFMLMPAAGFFSGISLGKRQGICPLYPAVCFVCYLIALLLLPGKSLLFLPLFIALPALAGNLVGWGIRRRQK